MRGPVVVADTVLRHTHPVPSPETRMGMKGCGEVGTIGAPAAAMNAAVDALSSHGVRHLDMRASPPCVWAAIRGAAAAA